MKTIFTSILLLVVLSSSAQTQATFYTNQGNIIVELYDWRMPVTTTNFKTLVQNKFYDGTIFHRVINNFMIQGGNAALTGGGTAPTIQDEFDATTSNVQFTIAMANTGAPNSGSSQFFINLQNNTGLDFDKAPLASKHPVFGQVITGSANVTTIGAVPTNTSDRPVTDVVIDSIRMTYLIPNAIEDVYLGSAAFQAFPNPIQSGNSIKFSIPAADLYAIKLYNMNGQVVLHQSTQLKKGINELAIPTISNLSKGTYFLVCSSAKQHLKSQLIIE